MKKSNGKRNIVITAIILTFIIFFNQIPANADVTDNLQNSIAIILGHVDDTLGTSFEQSTTNGKLNQMKKVVDTLDTSMDQMISPYVGSLTLWVDSNSGTYAGQTVTVTNAKGQNQTGQFVARNGHYEVDFPSLIKGSYSVRYPFYLSNGKKFDLGCSISVTGSIKRQLFGDLQQMTMADIQAACKAGVINQLASVGDTFSGGTNYTYTIIGIDQDKPSDTNGNLLPSNSYGNVLTVMPLGAPAGKGNNQPVVTNAYATPYATSYGSPTERINVSDISNAGWASSHMRSVIMASCYNKLPEATKNVIGSVQKITGTYFDGNQTTGDKVFLLSGKEVFGGSGYGSGSYCFSTEASATFQYQYFSNIATSIDSRKNITNVNIWWLRSPSCDGNPRFCYVLDGESGVGNESMEYGVLPAFCIY